MWVKPCAAAPGHVQVPVEWEPVSVRPVKAADGSTTVPQEVIDSLKANKVGLKGDLVLIIAT